VKGRAVTGPPPLVVLPLVVLPLWESRVAAGAREEMLATPECSTDKSSHRIRCYL